MSEQVRNPVDHFSCVVAHIFYRYIYFRQKKYMQVSCFMPKSFRVSRSVFHFFFSYMFMVFNLPIRHYAMRVKLSIYQGRELQCILEVKAHLRPQNKNPPLKCYFSVLIEKGVIELKKKYCSPVLA